MDFPKVPKIPTAPKMPEGAPKVPDGAPKAPKVPKVKIGEMPAQSFKEKHAGLLNKIPIILMLLAAIGGGAYMLFFKKKKKAPAAAAGAADGGVGAAGGAGGGGGDKKVCTAPPANVPLEATSAEADSPEEKAKVDAQKLQGCLRRPGQAEEIKLRVYPKDDVCDTCNWVVKVIFGEDLDGDELELGPGLDISGTVASEPTKKGKDGLQDLVFQMKQLRSGGLEACTYRMTGRPAGADVELEKCESLREGEEGTQKEDKK